MNQYNPYYNPYLSPTPIQQNIGYNQQNVLPPQQILQVSGKSSIEALKMSPNSSVLIADSQKPLIYKCISDGLGNCSIETYDVSLHKDEEKVEQENLAAMVHDLRMRIERLEHEQSNIRRSQSEPVYTERIPVEADNEMAKNDVESQGDGRYDAQE